MLREFHIWNFPKDKIRVKLKKEFSKDFFQNLEKAFKSQSNLSKYLGIHRNTVYTWKCGKKWILVGDMLKLSNILVKNNFQKFSREEVEKSILEIKSFGGENGHSIKNPQLPVVEDWRLIRLVGYLLGDGYAGERKSGVICGQMYTNKNPALIKKFLECVKLFGDMPTRVKYDTHGYHLRRLESKRLIKLNDINHNTQYWVKR